MPILSWTRCRLVACAGLAFLLSLEAPRGFAQTVFLDFNTPGQYISNFNPWNDNGTGTNGGNYSFEEGANAGVGAGGGVSVFQSSDTTASCKSGSWSFSTNGATLIVSCLLKANGQTGGNKLQLGILNCNTNGFNSNPGVAFESFRFIPTSPAVWSLREQYRSGNANTETILGSVNVISGHWYKLVVSLTNTAGALGNYNSGCALFDYGADGSSPGTNLVTFSTALTHTTGQDIAKVAAVWPGLRAFQNAGIDAWDNFLVYTTNSAPVITLPLTNTTAPIGAPLTLKILADGPGSISYSWYTNGTLAAGATNFTCTTPLLTSDFTNVMVVAANRNGSATNSAVITPIIPTLAAASNAPATGIQMTAATLNGQVLFTGGDPPGITLYYGPADGGTNPTAWAQSAELGAQSGSFALDVTGLLPGTTYFFAARAVNAAGTSWATPSETFTTLLVPPPPATYVNPFIGTAPGGASFGFSGNSGDTFPGAAYPRGMFQFSPDTPSNLPGGYNYLDNAIKGFSVRHFSGRGCTVYQDFAFMPCVGPVTASPGTGGATYDSGFSHANESATPGYYSVLLNNGVRVELTVTRRTGMARFTFPNTNIATLLINAGSSVNGTTANTAVSVIGTNQVQGYATAPIGCGSQLYTLYFAAEFDRAFTGAGTWNGSAVNPGLLASTGAQVGAFLTFDASSNPTVYAKVGISFVSISNAVANLDAENPGWDFAGVQGSGNAAWNDLLNKVVITGGTRAQLQTFYTALYHSYFHPNVFSDANGQYRGMDQQVHTVPAGHDQYENIPGWDCYRSRTPLGALLTPGEESDIAQSLVNYAQQGGGGLPRWEQANRNSGGMVGDGPVIILATTYALGATNFDTAGALAAMELDAGTIGTTSDGNTVRSGLTDYINLGYVSGQASVTLEYANADFALAQFEQAMGNKTNYTFLMRSGNWRNLYNTTNGFIQPRNADGSWVANITASSQTGFVEGSAAQYTWLVPYNLKGLFDAMGGSVSAVSRLDTYFIQLNAGPGSPYAFMGNEPSEPDPWEYDYAGAPHRTQATVRNIQTQLFTNTPGGLPGNDDAGALSSWYVFSALGLYPIIPGVGGFVLGSPLFQSATINLENGQQINIQGINASAQNCYVQSLTLNGVATTSLWLPFSAIRNGANLVATLGSAPSTWGTAPADSPPSFDNHPPLMLGAALSAGGQQISLFWPGWATNYTLYSATNLLAPASWSPVTNAPQPTNGVLYLSLPTANGQPQYFRLISP
ncbi:MAG TPA: GH92 family glycosyl hydrolase [Candidatus Acidoferrum sp.]|nr:GH92 family glycosyl hydrolase [Candidatus Acidoferrum sp.]